VPSYEGKVRKANSRVRTIVLPLLSWPGCEHIVRAPPCTTGKGSLYLQVSCWNLTLSHADPILAIENRERAQGSVVNAVPAPARATAGLELVGATEGVVTTQIRGIGAPGTTAASGEDRQTLPVRNLGVQ
jgi:hypothetical protein